MDAADRHRELYRRWLGELWAADFADIDRLVGEDFVGHWPDRTVVGRGELTAAIEETHSMFEEIAFELEVGPVCEGDLVAARWRGEGRSGGEVARFVGNDLLRVGDGLIREYWVATVTLG